MVPDPGLVQAHIHSCEDILLAEQGLWSEQTPRAVKEPEPAPEP